MATNTSPSVIEEMTTCPICFNTLGDPRSLPCLHTFCRRCLSNLISAERSRSICCPLCRKTVSVPPDGVEGFVKDFRIQSLIDLQAHEGGSNHDFMSTPTNTQIPWQTERLQTPASPVNVTYPQPQLQQTQQVIQLPASSSESHHSIWPPQAAPGTFFSTPNQIPVVAMTCQSVVGSIIGDERKITAVTSVGRLLFVARQPSASVIGLHDSLTLAFIRNIHVPGLSGRVNGLASVYINNRYILYVSDDRKEIHKVEMNMNGETVGRIKKMEVKGKPMGLWVNHRYNLLVTVQGNSNCKIVEYDSDGKFRRKIRLSYIISSARHAVQLANGNFMVSDGGRNMSGYQVCLVDGHGRIIRSYGSTPGARAEHLREPWDLAIDARGNVYVADCDNDRVVMLSSELTLICYIVEPYGNLSRPIALFLSDYVDRLFVGESDGNKRLLAYKLS